MIQMAADRRDGYLINASEDQMRVLRDGIDYALEHGEWTAICMSTEGTTPMRIKVSDTPELVLVDED